MKEVTANEGKNVNSEKTLAEKTCNETTAQVTEGDHNIGGEGWRIEALYGFIEGRAMPRRIVPGRVSVRDGGFQRWERATVQEGVLVYAKLTYDPRQSKPFRLAWTTKACRALQLLRQRLPPVKDENKAPLWLLVFNLQNR
jgi:hypothetical protein